MAQNRGDPLSGGGSQAGEMGHGHRQVELGCSVSASPMARKSPVQLRQIGPSMLGHLAPGPIGRIVRTGAVACHGSMCKTCLVKRALRGGLDTLAIRVHSASANCWRVDPPPSAASATVSQATRIVLTGMLPGRRAPGIGNVAEYGHGRD